MKIEIKDEIKYRDWLFHDFSTWFSFPSHFGDGETLEEDSWKMLNLRVSFLEGRPGFTQVERVEGFAETNGMSPTLEIEKREMESDGGPGAKSSVTVNLVQS